MPFGASGFLPTTNGLGQLAEFGVSNAFRRFRLSPPEQLKILAKNLEVSPMPFGASGFLPSLHHFTKA